MKKKVISKKEKGEQAMKALLEGRSEAVRDILPKVRTYIHNHRNELKACPFCNHSIKDREESIYRELIEALYRVYRWCGQNGRHEFSMKDIRHLLGKVDYPRFGNLHHYGGIVYKPEKAKKSNGTFGINMQRARELFRGERDIPLKRMVSMIDGDTVAETRVKIDQIPGLKHFLDAEGNYDHTAEPQILFSEPSKRGLPHAYWNR